MSNKTPILTPAGRLVQGDCFEGQTTDAEGRPLVIKNGPNAGQPRVDYFMAIAVPKTDPEVNKTIADIKTQARADFPSLFDASGNCINPAFAFKIIDGDSTVPNTRGIAPCTREGFPGHWVFNFSGGFAPKCYTAGGAELITDPARIKRGYYIRIYGSVSGNGSMQQPGVYLNHSMVEFVGYGEEIITGPSGEAIFGGTAAALPQGASATPVAAATPIAQPQQTVATPAAPATPVAPAPSFLNPPANTPAPPPPPPAAEVTYNLGGVEYTKAQLIANGWTEAQIAAQFGGV